MIRALICKVFVRAEFEQFGRSRVGGRHGTNLARVRIETINHSIETINHSVKGWRSAVEVSGLEVSKR